MNAGAIQFYATILAFICLAIITVMAADADDKCRERHSADTCFNALNR